MTLTSSLFHEMKRVRTAHLLILPLWLQRRRRPSQLAPVDEMPPTVGQWDSGGPEGDGGGGVLGLQHGVV